MEAARKDCGQALSTLGTLMLKGAGTILPKDESLGRRLIERSKIVGDRGKKDEVHD